MWLPSFLPSCPLVHRGFCFFNSVAIAAKQLQHKLNVSKILIVDWVRTRRRTGITGLHMDGNKYICASTQLYRRHEHRPRSTASLYSSTAIYYLVNLDAVISGLHVWSDLSHIHRVETDSHTVIWTQAHTHMEILIRSQVGVSVYHVCVHIGLQHVFTHTVLGHITASNTNNYLLRSKNFKIKTHLLLTRKSCTCFINLSSNNCPGCSPWQRHPGSFL